ncbi:MAG: hypothetical protein Q8O22_06905 [Candidatus Omnitrophota bacterium]|nr:hypothetical protein [Candidatus Omnitrophota bacterium]
MKIREAVLFINIILLAGCASVITRYGYDVKDISNKNAYLGCSIPIKKDLQYNKNDMEVLGSVKSGDTGFSLECGKGYVLGIFKQEACALGADLINITYERGFDIWSSCYRAKAEFLRFKDREKVKTLRSDAAYE